MRFILLGNVLNPPLNPPLKPLLPSSGSSRYHRPSRLAKYAKQAVITLIAFIVAAALLNQMIPSPIIPANIVFIGPKYDYYQTHKDDYDALFFGSSRVYSHVAPDVFDATAKANGVALSSYNFGIPAMRAIDSAVLLQQVLANPPKNLKWVFFESTLDKGYEPFANARTRRSLYWHTWKNTAFAARYILTSDESWPSKVVLVSSHLLPFLYQQLNVGRMFNQVLPSDFLPEEQQAIADFTQAKGYYGLSDQADPTRQAFLQNQPDYQAKVTALTVSESATAPQAPYLSANKQNLIDQVSEAIRAAGAEPIFIESPTLNPANDFRSAQQLGLIQHLLSYKNPSQFPQFYSLNNRYDVEHLNQPGSKIFTQQLAKDFSQKVAREDAVK